MIKPTTPSLIFIFIEMISLQKKDSLQRRMEESLIKRQFTKGRQSQGRPQENIKLLDIRSHRQQLGKMGTWKRQTVPGRPVQQKLHLRQTCTSQDQKQRKKHPYLSVHSHVSNSCFLPLANSNPKLTGTGPHVHSSQESISQNAEQSNGGKQIWRWRPETLKRNSMLGTSMHPVQTLD